MGDDLRPLLLELLNQHRTVLTRMERMEQQLERLCGDQELRQAAREKREREAAQFEQTTAYRLRKHGGHHTTRSRKSHAGVSD